MLEYKGTKITMFEGTSYKDEDVNMESDKLFYVAKSKFGKSFANNAEQAFNGAKQQIDRATR
jgi:hypothetical protein